LKALRSELGRLRSVFDEARGVADEKWRKGNAKRARKKINGYFCFVIPNPVIRLGGCVSDVALSVLGIAIDVPKTALGVLEAALCVSDVALCVLEIAIGVSDVALDVSALL